MNKVIDTQSISGTMQMFADRFRGIAREQQIERRQLVESFQSLKDDIEAGNYDVAILWLDMAMKRLEKEIVANDTKD